jgi:hypothetical protein
MCAAGTAMNASLCTKAVAPVLISKIIFAAKSRRSARSSIAVERLR